MVGLYEATKLILLIGIDPSIALHRGRLNSPTYAREGVPPQNGGHWETQKSMKIDINRPLDLSRSTDLAELVCQSEF